jgi:hypothetical protein
VAKLKVTNFDEKALDEAEYTDREDFAEYEGELPPRGTILNGRIKRVWATMSSNNNFMFKTLFEAEANGGDLAQYNGLPIWDNITFVETAAFRYKPFLMIFGLKVKDVKSRIDVTDDENETLGRSVSKIATWEPGSDDSRCQVSTKRRRYEGDWQVNVGRYLPFDADAWDEDAGSNGSGKKKDKAKKKGKKGKSEEDPF